MKSKAIVAALAGLMVVALLLVIAACGGSATTTAPSASSTTAPQTSSTTAAASTSTAAPESTTTSIKPAAELLVFAAGGTKAPMDAAAAMFEKTYGTKVTINYGGGGEILSNMVLAKKGDLFVAPEQRFMNSAKKQGAVDSSATPTPIAYMIPVIGVQKGNPKGIESLEDLAGSGIKIAMGNPETTLLGELTPEILRAADLYDAVNPNIVTNVPQVNTIITTLKAGQVDAGFIWHYFGTTAAEDVDIIWIPTQYVTGIGEVQAAVTTYSQEPQTAQLFLDFLTSADGKDIFKENGYFVDSEEAAQYWRGRQ